MILELKSVKELTAVMDAQIINYLIAREVPPDATDLFIRESWNGQMGWRWMFWAETVPAGLFFLLVFAIPESPRWLAKVSKWDRARDILARIGGEVYAMKSGEEIAASLRNAAGRVDFRALRSRQVRPVLLIGIILAVFQQWCGINVVFNYAEEVFSAAGYGVTDILFNIVITGATNLVFTFVAIRTVDRFGRKKLMLIGAGGLSLVYLVLGGSYYLHAGGIPIVSIIVLGIAVYAMSLAPVTWVVLSEIFPNRVRGAAMAVATTSLWIASSILVLTFPYLNHSLHTHGTFWLYSAVCLAGFLFILYRLPETRGKTLEEIEGQLTGKNLSP